MSKYFKEVKFERSEDPGRPKKSKVIAPNPEKFNEAVAEIEVAFREIKSGESDLTAYAIDNGTFGSPVGNCFKTLKSNPSVENIKRFVQITRQDLGGKAADHFKSILRRTIEETPNE